MSIENPPSNPDQKIQPVVSTESGVEREPTPEASEFNEYFDTGFEDLQVFNKELDELRQKPSTEEVSTRIQELEELIELLQEQQELLEECGGDIDELLDEEEE